MIKQEQIKEILTKNKILDEKGFQKAWREANSRKRSLEDYLIEKKIISEDLLYELAANFFKIPFTNLQNLTVPKDTLFLIPEPVARTHETIAFEKTVKDLKLATLNPKDLQIFEFIQKRTGLATKVYLTTPAAFKKILRQYHKSLKAEFEEITAQPKQEEKKELKELAQDLPTIRIVNTLLEYAIFEEASDIHIEPEEKGVSVRYRIDGILKKVMTLPKKIQSGVVARIKVLSNLKIDEHRLPQDGRFKIQTPDYKVSFRVSIIPVFDGEKIVLRLLFEKAQILTLEQLGLLSGPLEIVQKAIKKPHGMILATGPTGCGKTTTLYTMLNLLNTPQVNISTVEDPIEYRIPQINQSQVNPKIGYTFATGLRALLRQDPDIIMVGEIRDQETAEIAIHSALTGHLVLSTLHTNDAITTLPRLQDMGVPPFLIASTTNIVIAQRLVRKICSGCIQSFRLSPAEVKMLAQQIDVKKILSTLTREKIIAKANEKFESLLFYKGKGCSMCNNEGYKGRIGIYEVLEVTKFIASLITHQASQQELKKEAEAQKMITILEDGFIKAKNGITTISEVLRVTKE